MAWQGESCISLRNSAEAGRGDPFPWSPWSQREAVSWRIPEPQNGPCPFPGEVWGSSGPGRSTGMPLGSAGHCGRRPAPPAD